MDFVTIVAEVAKLGVSIGLAYWGLKHGLVELIKDVYGFIVKQTQS